MFEKLFRDRLTIAKHRNGPLSAEREAYLRKREEEGYSRESLVAHARRILFIAETFKKLSTGVTTAEIARTAKRWTTKRKRKSASVPIRLDTQLLSTFFVLAWISTLSALGWGMFRLIPQTSMQKSTWR